MPPLFWWRQDEGVEFGAAPSSFSISTCALRAPGVARLKMIWFSARSIGHSCCWRLVCRVCLLRLCPCCRSRTCICTGRSRTCICTSSTCSGRPGSRSRSLQCGKCLTFIVKPPFLVCGVSADHFASVGSSMLLWVAVNNFQMPCLCASPIQIERLKQHREDAVSNTETLACMLLLHKLYIPERVWRTNE